MSEQQTSGLIIESYAFEQQPKKTPFYQWQLVVVPQPASNAFQAQSQKRLFLQKVMEVEVVGLAFLLLLI